LPPSPIAEHLPLSVVGTRLIEPSPESKEGRDPSFRERDIVSWNTGSMD
jgi:hypothetical protein